MATEINAFIHKNKTHTVSHTANVVRWILSPTPIRLDQKNFLPRSIWHLTLTIESMIAQQLSIRRKRCQNETI